MIDNSPDFEDDTRSERFVRSVVWLGIIVLTLVFWVLAGIGLLRWLV